MEVSKLISVLILCLSCSISLAEQDSTVIKVRKESSAAENKLDFPSSNSDNEEKPHIRSKRFCKGGYLRRKKREKKQKLKPKKTAPSKVEKTSETTVMTPTPPRLSRMIESNLTNFISPGYNFNDNDPNIGTKNHKRSTYLANLLFPLSKKREVMNAPQRDDDLEYGDSAESDNGPDYWGNKPFPAVLG